jgi:hypothetical protein
MVKIRRGWYLTEHTNAEEKTDEKKAELEARQYKLMKQCDKKIAQRRLQAEQREACEKEKLLRAREAADLKQREIETSHKLAAELARRRGRIVDYILFHRSLIHSRETALLSISLQLTLSTKVLNGALFNLTLKNALFM